MFGKSKLSESTILDTLRTVQDPDLHRDIVSLGFVKEIKIDGGAVRFKVELTTPACPVKDQLHAECVQKVSALAGVKSVDVEMTANVRGGRAGEGVTLPNVKNIVAVASGKGGVGKSTTAINLALALKRAGAAVGLLDADVYGPSMAMMFGLTDRPQVNERKKLEPLQGFGIKVMSMGSLSDPDKPVIWRGPMVHGLLQQFLRDTDWGDLDYLVIDLPPGTGDAQLSISQLVPIAGAVIVTTPQDISLLDARKGLRMFQQMKVPVLGIVENMSYFICSNCQHRHEIFRSGGGKRAAGELGVPFLGEVPIDPEVVLGGDEGSPIVARNPASPAAKAYIDVAGQVAAKLSILAAESEAPSGLASAFKWQ